MSALGPRSLLASLLERSGLWKAHDLKSQFAGECLGAAVEHVPTAPADKVREDLAVRNLCLERLDLQRGNGVLHAAGQDRARLHPVDEHANRGPGVGLLGELYGFAYFPEVDDRLPGDNDDHVGLLHRDQASRMFEIGRCVKDDIGVLVLRYRNLHLGAGVPDALRTRRLLFANFWLFSFLKG